MSPRFPELREMRERTLCGVCCRSLAGADSRLLGGRIRRRRGFGDSGARRRRISVRASWPTDGFEGAWLTRISADHAHPTSPRNRGVLAPELGDPEQFRGWCAAMTW